MEVECFFHYICSLKLTNKKTIMEKEIIEEAKIVQMNTEDKTTEELREELRNSFGSKLETFMGVFSSELEKNGFILDIETISSSKGRFNRMVIFDK